MVSEFVQEGDAGLVGRKVGALAVETGKGSDGGATGDLVGELRELDVVDREEFPDLR